jgi:hypothetical protein
MATAESFRSLVVARAGGACEYCRLLELATGVTFHVEHVVPRSQRGKTTMANLALSCPGCNLAKGDRTAGKDHNGQIQSLFNPRKYEPASLGWHLNFAFDHRTGLILPRTPVGEATVVTLQINSPPRLFARGLQIRAGLIA